MRGEVRRIPSAIHAGEANPILGVQKIAPAPGRHTIQPSSREAKFRERDTVQCKPLRVPAVADRRRVVPWRLRLRASQWRSCAGSSGRSSRRTASTRGSWGRRGSGRARSTRSAIPPTSGGSPSPPRPRSPRTRPPALPTAPASPIPSSATRASTRPRGPRAARCAGSTPPRAGRRCSRAGRRSTARRTSPPPARLFFAFSFGPFLGFWSAFESAARIGLAVFPGGGMTTAARLRFLAENADRGGPLHPHATRSAWPRRPREEGADLGRGPVRALILGGRARGERARPSAGGSRRPGGRASSITGG